MSLEAAQLALNAGTRRAQETALTGCIRVERQIFMACKAWYVRPTAVQDLIAAVERVVEHGLIWTASKAHAAATLAWADALNAEPSLLGRVLEAKGFWKGVVGAIFEPPPPEDVLQVVYTPMAGKTWSERIQMLSALVQDKFKLAAQLAQSYSDGGTLEEIRKAIKPLVQQVDVSARRIVRTEGLRVAHAIQDRVDRIAEKYGAVEGYRYRATLDAVVRPHHAARHGFVYRTQEERIALPSEPNCRCYYETIVKTPVIDQTGVDRDYRKEFYLWLSKQSPERRRRALGESEDGWQERVHALATEDPEERPEAVRHARILRVWNSRNLARGRRTTERDTIGAIVREHGNVST